MQRLWSGRAKKKMTSDGTRKSVSDRLLAENIVLQTTIGDFDSFFTSNHRPVIIDIDAATYFGADTQAGIPRQVRILH